MKLYTLTPQKVGAVLGVGRTNLRLLVFKHFALVWETKRKSDDAV